MIIFKKMKSKLYILIFLLAFLLACDKPGTNCQQGACTQEFRMINIQTQDQTGKPAVALKVDAINARTKKQYSNIKSQTNPFNGVVSYTIATDGEKADFSEKGDKLTILFTTATTTFTSDFVISGGNCACHISKISGTNTIVIE